MEAVRAGMGAKGEVKKMERETRDICGFGFEGGVWILVWVWAVCMKCPFCTWKVTCSTSDVFFTIINLNAAFN